LRFVPALLQCDVDGLELAHGAKVKNIHPELMALTPFGPLVITLHRPALMTPAGKGTVKVVSLVCLALQYW
jgi:hypothetical protein